MVDERETILLLDSDSYTRWTLKALLESENYSVMAADTIETALKNLSGKISGFITEYWVNRSNTLETIRELKERIPEAYVMMLTDNVLNEDDYEAVINAGVDDYFIKPVPAQRVLLHLRKGLRQHSQILLYAAPQAKPDQNTPDQEKNDGRRTNESKIQGSMTRK